MIQELWGVEIDAERVDTNVLECATEDVGVAEEGSSYDMKRWKASISSWDKLPSLEKMGDVDATVCWLGLLPPNQLPPLSLPEIPCGKIYRDCFWGYPWRSQQYSFVCLDRPKCPHLSLYLSSKVLINRLPCPCMLLDKLEVWQASDIFQVEIITNKSQWCRHWSKVGPAHGLGGVHAWRHTWRDTWRSFWGLSWSPLLQFILFYFIFHKLLESRTYMSFLLLFKGIVLEEFLIGF